MTKKSLMALPLLAACALAHAAAPAEPQAVFDRYVQAVHAADMGAVRALIAPDVERSDYPACTAQMDNAACLAFYIDQTVVQPRARLTVLAVDVGASELTARLEVRSALYEKAGVERIVAAHPDQRVAAFAHGGVISEVLRQATGSRPFAFVGVDNGSISHLVVAGDRWVVRRVNDTGHLPGGFDLDPDPDLPQSPGFSA